MPFQRVMEVRPRGLALRQGPVGLQEQIPVGRVLLPGLPGYTGAALARERWSGPVPAQGVRLPGAGVVAGEQFRSLPPPARLRPP